MTRAKYPLLTVSNDMGWQQRGSGAGYNSPSGHAFFVGAKTRKAIAMCLKSKLCAICDHMRHKGLQGPVKKHVCMKNHLGSSGAMEAQAALEMQVELFEKFNVIVTRIVADDDASIRSTLSWSNEDYMTNTGTDQPPMVPITRGPNKGKLQPRPAGHGRLPGVIPQPTFVADPNHRRKLMTGELRLLAKQVKAHNLTMTPMDATRLGKNFGYMIRSLHRLPEEKHEDAAKAVLEHHFDNHQYCGEWCRRRLQSEEEKKSSSRYYRCKVKDAKLYKHLSEVLLKRHLSKKQLDELSHGMDTQVNESLNNTISWLAPKNKVYCASPSLANRISIAVGVNSIGLLAYYRRLFNKLGIVVTPDILHFLEVKDRNRSARLAKLKTTKKKKKRIQRKMATLNEMTLKAKRERARRDGTYKSGQYMAEGSSAGFTEEELQAGASSTTNRKKKSKVDVTCKHCGRQGHSRTSHQNCGKYTGAKKKAPPPVPMNLDAVEAEAMDSLPLDDDSNMEFFECDTWSDNEEGQQSGLI